jgi:hypothetical protein
MKAKTYDGPERRQYFRYNLIYSPKDKAKLVIGTQEYEVMDMSEMGLRFIKKTDTILEKQITGTLKLSNGKNKIIKGEIVWQRGDEVGVRFTNQ